jgi:hypothetical protein
MLQQSGNSQQENHAPSQGQGTRIENGTQQSTDDTLAQPSSSIDRRTALQAMVAGLASLTVDGAKAQTQESPTKAPEGKDLFTLGGVSIEFKNGLSPETLQRNFGAAFIEKDGKTYLQHSGKATPNPIEIGAETLSVQCSISDGTLHIRLIDKPDARGQQYAQFATIDKYGEFSVGTPQIVFNATNKLYPARSLQITQQEHPELHAALQDMAARGYSFEHALSAKSTDYYVLKEQSGKVIARFEHNLFKPGGIDESMKQWARTMKSFHP